MSDGLNNLTLPYLRRFDEQIDRLSKTPFEWMGGARSIKPRWATAVRHAFARDKFVENFRSLTLGCRQCLDLNEDAK